MNEDLPADEPGALDEGDDEPLVVVVTDAEHGERIDKLLADRDLGPSRSALQRFIAEGRVSMDGQPVDRRTKARARATIRVRPSPPPAYDARPEALPLTILHEDAHLLVLDKAAGMVVHPAPGHASGTLVNALLHHVAIAGGSDASRPGIVHRLDKDTSGVMVVAKTTTSHERLVERFAAHDLERRYLAIAVGAPPDEATFDTFHHRHPTDRKRFTSRVAYGRRAITHLRSLVRASQAALVECRLETGRTHQIRVHASDHGFPLLGDPVYGGSLGDPALRAISNELGRQALHAAVLGFVHPITGETLRFETKPPADFARAWASVQALG